ncbi:unnamed protein product [Sphagnum balticum]
MRNGVREEKRDWLEHAYPKYDMRMIDGRRIYAYTVHTLTRRRPLSTVHSVALHSGHGLLVVVRSAGQHMGVTGIAHEWSCGQIHYSTRSDECHVG